MSIIGDENNAYREGLGETVKFSVSFSDKDFSITRNVVQFRFHDIQCYQPRQLYYYFIIHLLHVSMSATFYYEISIQRSGQDHRPLLRPGSRRQSAFAISVRGAGPGIRVGL